mgnify:CR=1 FL=1
MSLDCNQTKWKGANQKVDTQGNIIECPKNPYRIYELEDLRAGFRDSLDPMMQAQMGLCGDPAYLNGAAATSAAGKYFCMIQILEDTVLNITAGNTDEINGAGVSIDVSPLGGKTLKAGMILNGNFKKIVLSSGFVKIYPHPFL